MNGSHGQIGLLLFAIAVGLMPAGQPRASHQAEAQRPFVEVCGPESRQSWSGMRNQPPRLTMCRLGSGMGWPVSCWIPQAQTNPRGSSTP